MGNAKVATELRRWGNVRLSFFFLPCAKLGKEQTHARHNGRESAYQRSLANRSNMLMIEAMGL